MAGKSEAKANFRSTHGYRCGEISNRSTITSPFVTERQAAITGNGISISNSISFNYQQTTYELEALLPDPFQQRLTGIQSGTNADGTAMTYAHEALLYEPATQTLTDPFGAMAGTVGSLKRINTPNGYGPLAKAETSISWRFGCWPRRVIIPT